MKILFTLMFACMISGGAILAQDDSREAGQLIDGPKIEFIETTHDFGSNPQGTPVTTDFVFKNIGNDFHRRRRWINIGIAHHKFF